MLRRWDYFIPYIVHTQFSYMVEKKVLDSKHNPFIVPLSSLIYFITVIIIIVIVVRYGGAIIYFVWRADILCGEGGTNFCIFHPYSSYDILSQFIYMWRLSRVRARRMGWYIIKKVNEGWKRFYFLALWLDFYYYFNFWLFFFFRTPRFVWRVQCVICLLNIRIIMSESIIVVSWGGLSFSVGC